MTSRQLKKWECHPRLPLSCGIARIFKHPIEEIFGPEPDAPEH
jgi:DNA-binding XRE family transcriptional regulator